MQPADPILRRIEQQLRDLTEANAALTRRVFALETEIARTKPPDERGFHTVAEVPPALPPPLPPPVFQEVAEAPGIPEMTTPEPVVQADFEPKPTLETNVGLTWINRIGAITVMFGVAFFFKYAVDNDWIGPGGRVILGVLAGMGAIFAGDRLWHRGQKIFAQGIQALGSVILYLSFFAAFSFYSLIPQGVAFVLMFATTAMTGALALRYNARATLILGLLGGWCTPFLLSKGEPNDIFFLSYMLLLNGGAMYVARLKEWKGVETIVVVGMWLVQFIWCAGRAAKAGRWLGALFVAPNYALTVLSIAWWNILFGQFAASMVLAVIYERQWGPFLPALLAVFLAGLAVAWQRNLNGGAFVATASFWLAQAAGSLNFPEQHVTELMLVNGAFFAAILSWAVFRAAQSRLHKLDLLSAAGGGVIYYTTTFNLLDHEYHAYLGLFTVFVAAAYLALGYGIYRVSPEEKRDTTGPLLGAGLALAFLALAVPVQLTGFRITIAWAIQSAALTWIAYRLKDKRVLVGAAALAFLAVSRLATQDSLLYWPQSPESYTLLLNSRFISFLCVCGSLFLSAWWISKMEGLERFVPGIPYLLAHLLLIWGIHLELFAYIDSHPELASRRSMKTLVSSLILAGYGFQFIASGFARRAAFPRILGLGMFAIVIVKLYLYDVWLLDVTYRMIAFILLGAMLLASSYLYSRFRDKLSTLIRDE